MRRFTVPIVPRGGAVLRTALRATLTVAPLLALAACVGGPSSALGGPIGMAPDLKASEILAIPDSTAGTGFVILSNRRDLLDATRLQLSAAGRSFERLFGYRPPLADIRLTSEPNRVTVALRVLGSARPSLTIPIDDGRRGRSVEPIRVSFAITRVVSDMWLAELATSATQGTGGTGGQTSWITDARVPFWLRAALLEGVAGAALHDVWLTQLGRTRETLPTVPALMAGDGCDSACRATIASPQIPPSAADAAALDVRGAPRIVDPITRYRATTASFALFMARREGAPYMRSLLETAIAGKPIEGALTSATSFSGADDANRQWRVWLATFFDGPGR